jgi:Tol biopolymer transport system component
MSADRPATQVRLDSWKDIAAYLNRDVRTVIRWEHEKGLPVHRVPGGKRQAVFAYKHEIDKWLVGQPANGNHGGSDASENRALVDKGTSVGISSAAAAVREQTSDSANLIEEGDAGGSALFGVEIAKRKKASHKKTIIAVLGLAAFVILGLALLGKNVFVPSRPAIRVRPISLQRLTNDGHYKGNLRTDGETIYFNRVEGGRAIIAAMPVNGGSTRIVETPFPHVNVLDLFADGKSLLVMTNLGINQSGALWKLPIAGGPPKAVSDVMCNFARWSPDNGKVACAHGTGILLIDPDGSHLRTISSSLPVSHLLWSPDGRTLRYVTEDPSTGEWSPWEIEVGATNAQPRRLSLGSACCVDWTWSRDGRDFVYAELNGNLNTRLMLKSGNETFELPVNIGAVFSVTAGANGNSAYVAIADGYRGELLKFNAKQKSLETFLPGISGAFLAYSPDRQCITYINSEDFSLWRSKADGSDKLQLAKGMEVQVSSWSPDGNTIAFMGQLPGKPFRIYFVGADGGEPREASEGSDGQGGPSWAPDGKTIVYGNVFCERTQNCWIRRLDVASGKTEIIPGSNGLRTARWSPDGKYIAALRFQTHELMLFDIAEQKWRVLADSVTGDNIYWCADSKCLYVDSPLETKPVIERIRIDDGKREIAVSLADLQKVPGQTSNWFGMTPDGSPIVFHVSSASEIYEVKW